MKKANITLGVIFCMFLFLIMPNVSAIEYQNIIEENKQKSIVLIESFKERISTLGLGISVGIIIFLLSIVCLIATVVLYPLGSFLMNFHQFTIGLGIALYAISLVTGMVSLPLLLLACILSPFMGFQVFISPYFVIIFSWLLFMYSKTEYTNFLQFFIDLIDFVIVIITPG